MVVHQGANDPYFSIKCAVASFFANYIVGVFHPLELLKTRFQSTWKINQAMTERIRIILYLSTKELSREFEIFTNLKEYQVFLRVSI